MQVTTAIEQGTTRNVVGGQTEHSIIDLHFKFLIEKKKLVQF